MRAVELIAAQWSAPGNILAAATTRNGGASAGPYAGLNLAEHVGDEPGKVVANRRQLAQSLDFPFDFQWLRQVHGNQVAPVAAAGPAPEADSLVTRRPGIALCVLGADCLPVFLASRAGDEVAIIHGGWRGLGAGIIENTLSAMQTPPEQLLAWIGPAILACHYQTGGDLRQAFLDRAANAAQGKQLNEAFDALPEAGKFLADLPRIARIKLRALGVTAISGAKHCTHCDAQRFYSHRRDGVCGRMANLIGIKAAP